MNKQRLYDWHTVLKQEEVAKGMVCLYPSVSWTAMNEGPVGKTGINLEKIESVSAIEPDSTGCLRCEVS